MTHCMDMCRIHGEYGEYEEHTVPESREGK